jgi:hypothetical protein
MVGTRDPDGRNIGDQRSGDKNCRALEPSGTQIGRNVFGAVCRLSIFAPRDPGSPCVAVQTSQVDTGSGLSWRARCPAAACASKRETLLAQLQTMCDTVLIEGDVDVTMAV